MMSLRPGCKAFARAARITMATMMDANMENLDLGVVLHPHRPLKGGGEWRSVSWVTPPVVSAKAPARYGPARAREIADRRARVGYGHESAGAAGHGARTRGADCGGGIERRGRPALERAASAGCRRRCFHAREYADRQDARRRDGGLVGGERNKAGRAGRVHGAPRRDFLGRFQTP